MRHALLYISISILLATANTHAECQTQESVAIPLDAITCIVRSFTDGDTVKLDCGGGPFAARLHCIDAPELAQTPWGERSRDNLKRITPATVRVVEVERDRYNRSVVRIFDPATDTELSARQVRDGAAAVYTKYCHDQALMDLQGIADAERIGIWATPGSHQTPWIFRRFNGAH